MAQTGYIYKRRGKRASSWWLKYYEPRLVNGKVIQRQVAKRLAPVDNKEHRSENSRAVQDAAAKILGPINARIAQPTTEETLHSFIENVYMAKIRGGGMKPSTRRTYEMLWRLVSPWVNGRRLSDIGTPDINEILTVIGKQKKRARTSLLNVRNFLSGAFRFAINRGFVKTNPVREVDMKEITREYGLDPTDERTHAYTLDEVAEIVAALGEPARTVVTVAAFTGLRKGELMGLKWEDYTGDALHVRRSFWQSFETKTKTKSSEAPVPVIAIVKRALDKYRKQSGRDGWIFKGERKGFPLNLNNIVRRKIIPQLEEAGITWHGWHAFRRGLASNLHALGVSDLDIMAVLRHGDIETTQRHYIKLPPTAAVAAMRKLEKALGGRSRK